MPKFCQIQKQSIPINYNEPKGDENIAKLPLMIHQEPLENDFERVLRDNIWELYEERNHEKTQTS